jgi:hypothetical protein
MPDIAASPTDVVLTKRCSVCGEELPLAMFSKNKAKCNGLQSACKQCMKKYSIVNPITPQTYGMVANAKRRAQSKHLEFNIDTEYVRSLVVTHCPVLGIPLEWSRYRGNGKSNVAGSPSLDRIDPTKGYVKGNVWIISAKANRIKNDATHEELKLVAKAVGEAIVKSLEF